MTGAASMLALALLVGAGCGGAPEEARVRASAPAAGPGVRVSCDLAEVDLGRAFELSVVRRWPADALVDPFDPRQLRPLELVERDRSEHTADGLTRERLRFAAYAFAPGDLRLDAVRLLLRDGQGLAVRELRAAPVELTVRTSLPADDPGEAELPGGPLPLPETHWEAWLLLALVAVALVVYGRGVRREREAADGGAVRRGSTPLLRARARLARLATAPPGDPVREADELTALLRDYLVDGLSVRARERTTPELLSATDVRSSLPQQAREALGRLLPDCDATRFAAGAPTADERAFRLAEAARVLVEPPGVPEGGQPADDIGPGAERASADEGGRGPARGSAP